MMSQLNEAEFENIIYDHFTQSALYVTRTPQQYDQEWMFDVELLRDFLQKTQPIEWKKLVQQFPEGTIEAVMEEFKRLRNARGILELLRFGFTLRGAKFQALVAFTGAVQFEGEEYKYTEANMNPQDESVKLFV